MSSDAMTYALEHGGLKDEDKRVYKVRIIDEWRESTKDCKARKFDKTRMFKMCKISDKICDFNDCFIRFVQSIKC